MLTIAQQQEMRIVGLEFLATRYPNSYTADAIKRMLMRRQRVDFQFTESDTVAALTFLKDEELVQPLLDNLHAIPAWQATSKGVLQFQRKEAQDNPEESRL